MAQETKTTKEMSQLYERVNYVQTHHHSCGCQWQSITKRLGYKDMPADDDVMAGGPSCLSQCWRLVKN